MSDNGHCGEGSMERREREAPPKMGEMKPLSNEELDWLEDQARYAAVKVLMPRDQALALIAMARRTPPTTQGEKPSGSCSASPGVGENVPSEALEPVREAMAALDRVETECPVRRASSSIEVCPACRATSSDGCAKAAVAGNRVIEAARTAISAAPPAPFPDQVGEGERPKSESEETLQRGWLATQMLDARLTNEEAFSIVAFHPCVKDARDRAPSPDHAALVEAARAWIEHSPRLNCEENNDIRDLVSRLAAALHPSADEKAP